MALVDWDPYGFDIARQMRDSLVALGLRFDSLDIIPKLDDFTARDRALHATPLDETPRTKPLGGRWLASGGGVEGQPLGLPTDAIDAERLTELLMRAAQAALDRPD